MAQLLLSNPKRRRKSTKAKARRKSPSRRLAISRSTTVKRYRRNPVRRLKASGIVDQFMGGAVGAGGALAVDFAMSKLPIPDNMRTGPLGAVVKGMVGIGLGMAVAKFGKQKKIGEQMAAGAVTVSLYSFGKATFGSQLGLAGDEGLLGFDNGLLGYTDFNDGLGWASPAPVFDTEDSINGYQTNY